MASNPIQHPTAFCPVHGLFPATGIALGTGSSVTFLGSITNCPICGRDSEIIPGTYEALPTGLNLILDPSVSPEALEALRDIVGKLQREEITPEEAATAAREIDPKFGHALGIAIRIGAWAVTAVIALLSLYLQLQDGRGNSEQSAAILQAITDQTAVLEQIAAQSASEQPHEQPHEQNAAKSDSKAEPKTKAKPTAEKPKSNRRQQVNSARREALKLRRQQFNPKR